MKTFASMRAMLVASVSISAFAATLIAPQTAAAEEASTIAEVIVTAQKKLENINDVPLSLTAVSGEKLAAIRSGGGDIRMLSARILSLTLESSFGRTFPCPYIRGLGNTDFDINASQPVSFIYDEVVPENPVLKGFPPFGPGFIRFPSESADGAPFHGQFTQEIRLAGDTGPPGDTVGAFYFNESIKIDSYSFNTLAGGALDGRAYQSQKT